MARAIQLPGRRHEDWRWSPLDAALADTVLGDAPSKGADDPVLVQVAAAMGRHEQASVGPGESRIWIDRIDGAGLQVRSRDVRVAEGGLLTRVVLQHGDGTTLDRCRVTLDEGARFHQFTLSFGGRYARLETEVEVAGQGAQTELRGAYLVASGRHADLTSRVLHSVGGARTTQLVKGVVDARGRGVFQGRITVARDAQRTLAEQHHDGLLLADGAEILAKPELEIYADDVECAHGNTAGALDEGALFYMRSRGIGRDEARALLIQAFVGAAVPDWLPAAIGDEVGSTIAAWLDAQLGAGRD